MLGALYELSGAGHTPPTSPTTQARTTTAAEAAACCCHSHEVIREQGQRHVTDSSTGNRWSGVRPTAACTATAAACGCDRLLQHFVRKQMGHGATGLGAGCYLVVAW